MADLMFPIFDAHQHYSQAYFDQILDSFTECGVKGGINLWGNYAPFGLDYRDYEGMLKAVADRNLDTFVQFYWPNWKAFGWEPERFVKCLCRDMRRFAPMGCRGLKVWKDVGMFIIHPDGIPARMDDPRLDAVWETAGELGWTISVHQADPARAWTKPHFVRTGLSREQLFERRNRVLAKYPGIRFILCHNGNDAENVRAWGALMDDFPNCVSDMNRDPLEHDTLSDTQAFLEKYADRVLFGTDLGMPDDRPPDRKWNMEELFLPWRRRLIAYGLTDDTLRKLTWENGERLFLGR